MRVWTNGCFDILHRGHIEMFKYAKSLGDYLIVGIDSDARVAEVKGPNRPVNTQKDRKRILEAIRYIDEVQIFNDDNDLKKKIKQSKIDILIVGSDWQHKEVIGSKFAKKLCFFNRLRKYSTTNIIEKVCDGLRI